MPRGDKREEDLKVRKKNGMQTGKRSSKAYYETEQMGERRIEKWFN